MRITMITRRVLASVAGLVATMGLVAAQGDAPSGMLADLVPEANESHLYSVHFANDGKSIVTVLDHKIHVWDATTFKELRSHTMKESEQRLSCAPDGKTYAWNVGTEVALVDAESGDVSKTLSTQPDYGSVTNLAYTPDGKSVVAVGGVGMTSVLWIMDPAAGTHKLVKGPENNDNFYALAISADGKMVACGANRSPEIYVYELESGKQLHKLTNGTHLSKHLAFSPDGKLLATCGFEEPVRVYDTTTGKVVAKLEHPFAFCVAFSPTDPKLLASSDREVFCLWNVETKKNLAICGRKGPHKAVTDNQGVANGPEDGMCFSPDGKRLCWGCEYEEWAHVRVWDVAAVSGEKK
jgi:WD40 repeat protein